ncbi:PD-(D/E)XK nuclease-like domain-containing protein [Salmonella enterica subsp. enterica serovar Bareilly]|uniref:Exodeoxyribonuclease n=1 Tax=Salmonella enterica subsp. enterica serovar Bareilly TaxID=58096 RepID=A0A5W2ZJ14_SALET|nr:RecE family exodeoxyribonuclease [Salmonella enterica]EAB8893655.1 exodeoxyribonuclease [Salmonella enterica subsp. enterica serovar Bareilly]KDR06180.1 exodeoxyribonuclease [Salmonella enterica subsp. enterica serovar Bareilly str. CFSAN000226]EAZ2563219.1 exodeoxyribonuclease [Salmonella enterica]EBW5697525.1 exodeoxyribonuclease [Salmonella enterica subsp. enterica serovar Bareilly]EBX8114763.1 exodeoxyribonuclease [Salmonella enterica subsp. enterica serovar Bareilly]
MEFFYVVKATQKSGKQDATVWFTAKSEARANLMLDVVLEDAEIETGRGKDYARPIRTNFPVVNELPPEGEISFTFTNYYRLGEDGMTWEQIPGVTLPSSEAAAAARQHIVDGVDTETGEVLEDHTENFGNESNSPAQATAPAPELTVVATMPLRHRVLAQYIGEGEYLYHVDASQKKEILRLEMDTDNSYVQNLLLAAENVEAFKKAIEHDIHKIVNAVKKVFPVDGKTPELATVIQFLKTWFETEHIDRGLLVKEWAKGNRVSAIQRTESGANAGGSNKTDRNPDYEHTLDTLDVEIAMATLPMDFNIYELPGSVSRRAKEIVKKKESPFKEWSAALRATPGILDYSRAAIFALIRSAHPEFYHYPGRLQGYINANLTETDHENPTEEALTAARHTPEKDAVEEANRQLAAARGEYVEGISDPNDPKWVKTETSQPTTEPELVKNVGNGIFDVSALMQNSSTHGTETNPETTSNVQVQKADSDEKQAGDAVQAGEGDLGTGKEAVTVENQNQAETHQNNDSVSQSEPEAQQNVPESQQEEPEAAWPEYFEPGRYEGVPNEVYHAANGISSTQVKDARVSLMYFNARHVEKTIVKERSPVLDMGNLVHALALQPENLEAEFSVEPEIPEGAFTTTATLREFIDAHNASLPALLSADDIKALLEEYNATLPSQMPLGASVDETYASYEQLPEEFQRIENGTKHTATAMKACIKEYNATLPAPVKTSGSRDALLEQLAIINPDLVAQEAQKSSPLKVSGTKADLIQAVKSVNPAAVFADELLDAWRENTEGKVLVTRQQLSTALNIQKALLEHPTAGKLLTHPSRAVEVSYFGIDEETGLEVRVRPDLEIDMGGLRIGADLKTISMWNIKQEGLRAKLHREIIDRDYHLSAAMYCETAALDQFFWIFVNKDENYHWVAIIEASTELLELGMLEYRKTMRAIANGFDTGEWPAPITEDYTDELNDFDVRRLEALRVQA